MTDHPYAPRLRLLWALIPSAQVELEASTIRVSHPSHAVQLRRSSSLVLRALRRLELGGVALENVLGLAEDHRAWVEHQPSDFNAWHEVSAALEELGGLVTPMLAPLNAGPPLISTPATAWTTPPLALTAIPADAPLRLVRGAQIRAAPQWPVLHVPSGVRTAAIHESSISRLLEVLEDGARDLLDLAHRSSVDPVVAYDVTVFLRQPGLNAVEIGPAAAAPTRRY